MTITYSEMVAKLAKPGVYIMNSLTADEAHLLHMAVGISGEVAEVLTAIVNDDRDNCLEELGDIEFYFEGLCQGLGGAIAHTVVDMATIKTDPFTDVVIQAGNVLDITKKISVYKADKKMQLHIEAQRLRHSLDKFYAACEFTVEQAKEANMAKLATRYEGFEYSNEAAQARKDKAGE